MCWCSIFCSLNFRHPYVGLLLSSFLLLMSLSVAVRTTLLWCLVFETSYSFVGSLLHLKNNSILVSCSHWVAYVPLFLFLLSFWLLLALSCLCCSSVFVFYVCLVGAYFVLFIFCLYLGHSSPFGTLVIFSSVNCWLLILDLCLSCLLFSIPVSTYRPKRLNFW